VNEQAKTFIIGFGVAHSEKTENIKWMLQNLIDYFEAKPKIICSDSCPSLEKEIHQVMPETTHLLCGWHYLRILRLTLQA